MNGRPLKIGITCYPTVGGSGILASELGEELARRGHEVHFISYERPFRMPADAPRVFFHPVVVNSYDLFKYPDYTLPLSVKMAEVTRDHGLDVLHVHYAVPHATAALLARDMLPAGRRPQIITTLHGTDTTLLAVDPGYGPAIRHALEHSDAITTVSEFMRRETVRLLGVRRRIEVIPNFFEPHPAARSVAEVRRELGLADGEAMLLHLSNLRPLKRVDLLLETVARLGSGPRCKLVILAGGSFAPFAAEVARQGLGDRVVLRDRVTDIEDYLQAADLGLFTSETESFCLSILELMSVGCPSAAFAVGGIPEVTVADETGVLVPFGETAALADAVRALLRDPGRRAVLGRAARERARERFSAAAIVPQYERLYREVCAGKSGGTGCSKPGAS
jgi:N-acetyl-alpha-D-glucosaminyl L-malate synthase BshA